MDHVHYDSKISYYTSWLLKLVLIGLFIFATFTNLFPLNITILITVFLAFSPSFIERSYKFHFPVLLDLVITAALLLDSIGRVFKLYHTVDYWWWDIMTHFTGTAMISLIAFYIMFTFLYLKKIRLPYWAIGLFTFSIAMTIGALWEIGEFYFDYVTGYNTYLNEANSIRDMLFDVVGGSLVAIIGSIYIKHIQKKKKR